MKTWVRHIIWFVLSLVVVTGGACIMDSENLLAAVPGLFIIYSWCWVTCRTKMFEVCPIETWIKKLKHKE